MSSKQQTLNRLDQLNSELDRILTMVEPIHDNELSKQPAPDKWSVIQVFNHLLDVENAGLSYLEYKEKQSDVFQAENLKTKLKFFGYQLALRLPLRFKMPKTLSQPPIEGSFNSIQNEFQSTRIKYLEFIQRQDEDFFTKATFKHPLIGRITLSKAMKFMKIHLLHHEKQILRTLIAISKTN